MNTSNAKYAIVVGIDGSGESLPAVRWAVAAARLRHEPLHIVYGFAPLSRFYGAGMPMLQNAYDDLVRAGERVVAEAVGAAREITDEHVRITSEMLNEPAAPLLVERSRNARMIVLGSAGRVR
ncbi:universal stress protein [Amycolatopsis sp. NPDC006131]|uniref:universal stress protein n=1 Tax=Amycolatopsis sp. NPDC006131 TaxID=3156731 RepID=UPI0033A2FC68